MSEIAKRIYEKYEYDRIIGRGAYGIVWRAQDRHSKHNVAIKKIIRAFGSQTRAQSTFREVCIFQLFVDHPNIVKILSLEMSLKSRDIHLILEYLDMDLQFAIKEKLYTSISERKSILYQVFRALIYIHSANVLHLDLKPSNILLNKKCQVKVADFGSANSVSQMRDIVTEEPLTQWIGAIRYMAPEILLEANKYTTAVDIWSVGCILGEMLLEEPLFRGFTSFNLLDNIMVALPYTASTDFKSMLSPSALAVLEKASTKPKRLLPKLFSQETDETIDFISRLLALNPQSRLSAEQAIDHPYLSNLKQCSILNDPKLLPAVPLYDNNISLTVVEYRDKLYQMMSEIYVSGNNSINKLENTKISHIAEDNSNKGIVNLKREIPANNIAGCMKRLKTGDATDCSV